MIALMVALAAVVPAAAAKKGGAALSATAVEVPAGFHVEMLHSALPGQGSWVAMTFDGRGRIIASDQAGPLYRMTVPAVGTTGSTIVEPLDTPMGQCQGLLWAYDSLYCSANIGKPEKVGGRRLGLYRLRDRDGDDRFEDVTLLKEFLDDRGQAAGGKEHGPHGIVKGPDGRLWVIAGNNTQVPSGIDLDSPHRNFDEDLLLPRRPDGRGHNTGVMAPGGWVASTDPEGKHWRLHAAGLRNPYDLAFDPRGELFTFDADMEWDVGTSWYRPTRVNHLISGAEMGWRYGTGKWPATAVDSVGAVVDIGPGSPTGITFGYGAKFPARYQRALFLLDWSYGRIFAAHMQPDGSTFTGTSELFASGKPLPVTDAAIGPDGSLYFTTGGRGTQTGLYRIMYTGPESTDAVTALDTTKTLAARALRHKLEAFHGKVNPAAVGQSWPLLGSPDRALRFAARVAIEGQPIASFRARALAERRPDALIAGCVALARNAGAKGAGIPETERPALRVAITRALLRLPWPRLNTVQVLDATRALELAFIRLGRPETELAAQVIQTLKPLFMRRDRLSDRALFSLWVYLDAPGVVDLGLAKLAEAGRQDDEVHYAFVLRNVKRGWTLPQKKIYFSWLRKAETQYKGGASWTAFMQGIRADATENFVPDPDERKSLGDLVQNVVTGVAAGPGRTFVREWTMDDFPGPLPEANQGRSFKSGQAALQAAQCLRCHLFQGEGGAQGPDLSFVGNRFSARELLDSILRPSAVLSDQYQTTQLLLKNGEGVTGAVVSETPTAVIIRPSWLAEETVTVPKADIKTRALSDVSLMPEGLVSILRKEELLDLLAYLRSGAKKEDHAFQAAAKVTAK